MSTTVQVTLEIGSAVWVGPPSKTKTTWTLLAIRQAAEGVTYATVRSGHFERDWIVPVERLVPFTGKEFK